jgi:hypothetical protein
MRDSSHALDRLSQRGVSSDMVRDAILEGQAYWNQEAQTFNFVLRNYGGTGKDLLISVGAYTNNLVTAIYQATISIPQGVKSL